MSSFSRPMAAACSSRSAFAVWYLPNIFLSLRVLSAASSFLLANFSSFSSFASSSFSISRSRSALARSLSSMSRCPFAAASSSILLRSSRSSTPCSSLLSISLSLFSSSSFLRRSDCATDIWASRSIAFSSIACLILAFSSSVWSLASSTFCISACAFSSAWRCMRSRSASDAANLTRSAISA